MKIKNISNSPYVLLILAPLFWSGNFIVGRLIHENIPPLGLSFWRWLLASVIIFFIARAPLRRDWIRIKKNLPLLFLLSVLSVSTFNPLISDFLIPCSNQMAHPHGDQTNLYINLSPFSG